MGDHGGAVVGRAGDNEGKCMIQIRCIATVTVAIGVFLLAACGGGGGGSGSSMTRPVPQPETPRPPPTSSNPAYHLGTARFTTHQPNVLEQVGAHHAYARGLTGRGVRIGIEGHHRRLHAKFGIREQGEATRCGRRGSIVHASAWEINSPAMPVCASRTLPAQYGRAIAKATAKHLIAGCDIS